MKPWLGIDWSASTAHRTGLSRRVRSRARPARQVRTRQLRARGRAYRAPHRLGGGRLLTPRPHRARRLTPRERRVRERALGCASSPPRLPCRPRIVRCRRHPPRARRRVPRPRASGSTSVRVRDADPARARPMLFLLPSRPCRCRRRRARRRACCRTCSAVRRTRARADRRWPTPRQRSAGARAPRGRRARRRHRVLGRRRARPGGAVPVDLLGSIAASGSAAGSPPQLRVIVSRLPDRRVPDAGRPAGRGAGPARRRRRRRAVPLLGLFAAFAHDRRARIDELRSRAIELRKRAAGLEAVRRVGEASGPGLDGRRCSIPCSCGRRLRRRRRPGPCAAFEAGGGARHAPAADADGRGRQRAANARPAGHTEDGRVAREPLGQGATWRLLAVARHRARPSRRGGRAVHHLAGPDVRGHGERRAPRADQPRGARRRAHRAGQPPRTSRSRSPRRATACGASPAARARDDRRRPLQGVQRHLWPPARRRGAARGGRRGPRRVRSTDAARRATGGEELAVALPDTDLDGAFAAGEQIRRAVEEARVEWPGGRRCA